MMERRSVKTFYDNRFSTFTLSDMDCYIAINFLTWHGNISKQHLFIRGRSIHVKLVSKQNAGCNQGMHGKHEIHLTVPIICLYQ